MDFAKEIAALKSKAEPQLHALNTKEKTKNALFLPFLRVLGYDVFDVREVEPEFTADLGNGGKKTVDYALKKEGAPIVLFECEEAGTDLDARDPDPLFLRLRATDARVGGLTNGVVYRFFADFGEEAAADKRPFLVFSLLDYTPEEVEALRRMRKPSFDTEAVLAAARDRKYRKPLLEYLDRQRDTPDEQFVQFLTGQIYEGEVTDSVRERFRPVVRKALSQFGQEGEEASPTSARREDERMATEQREGAGSSGEEESESPEREKEESSGKKRNTEQGQSKPFEKNLAERVIEDF